MNLEKIAALVGGTVNGDGSLEISGLSGIVEAGPGQLTYAADRKYLKQLAQCKASAVLVPETIETACAQIVVANPALAFAKLLSLFHPAKRPPAGVDSQAAVGNDVRLGKDVTVSPFVAIGDRTAIADGVVLHPGVSVGADCVVGENCVLHANVTLYPGTVLGRNVILHAGVVVGADGFGYTPDEKGRHFKIPQVGNVVIEDDVEIGANSCVDRAALGTTRIKQGTKIDNLVQIAHNCTVGEHSILVAQSGVAGSSQLGRYVVLAGQAGVADHVTIGDQAILTARAGTFRDLEGGQAYGGNPSVPLTAWKKYVSQFPKLPEMARKIKDLEARLQALEKK